MDDVKIGISDMNSGVLEGVVKGNARMSNCPNGKKALNMTIETTKITRSGMKFFTHDVVAFESTSTQFEKYIKDGVFVRLNYHLMSMDVPVGEGEHVYVVKTSRPVVTFMEIESPLED